ncbi:GIY-YIG catalytic domain-containing endonuclease [Acanthocystis turfacea Chlorella virus Can0610SP]|nr:GIY-YIG catalytic domain-containing endonuclease [Acanthocystis turfacea Chlorella virus Can0610SP]
MVIAKKRFDIGNLYFVLDNVMFWEAFRWEMLDTGYIYIQKFSNGKMYAGLTTNLPRRMKAYKQLRGNNDHHTKALKKHGDTMQISFTQCPKYLLDAVEIFMIAFFDLTDPSKGYNKQTGGRKSFRHTKETCMKISESKKGEKNPNYGKIPTEETRAKMCIAQSGENNPMCGRTHDEGARKKISDAEKGERNHNSKPICVFGKLYDAASTASNILRDVCNTKSKCNFVKNWIHKKTHPHNVFYVSKEFYNAMKGTSEIITRDIYMFWVE